MNNTRNIENTVCSAETMSGHPELYHYTNAAAFESIADSQTLWCSHYREMLDTEEVLLMRKLLPSAIAPRMDVVVGQLNRQARRRWKASGGGTQTALDLVNSLYGATFDGAAVYSALDVYLFSFSTHAGDTAFDRENGLRSQWDCYAGCDGYCLIFDTNELVQMLAKEMDSRYWMRLTLDSVRYADRPVHEIFPELVNASADTLRQFIHGVKNPEMAVREFLAGTTLLKGAAYKAEREVRIVAIPGTATVAKYAAIEYPNQFDATKPLPEIGIRPDTKNRYVALLADLDLRLPIKRIIVGPGARQAQHAERARSKFRDVTITMSRCS